MTTAHTTKHAAEWLAAHPAPIHTAEVPAWADRVRGELGEGALGELVELLARGDLEQQYQAVAAARVLGAEVWAEGEEPELTWLVTLPGEARPRAIRPAQQLAGRPDSGAFAAPGATIHCRPSRGASAQR